MWDGKYGATKGTNRNNRMIGAFFVELGGKYIATYLSRHLEVYITKSELQCMKIFFFN